MILHPAKIKFTKEEIEMLRGRKMGRKKKEDVRKVCSQCGRKNDVGIYRRRKGQEEWWCINCIRKVQFRDNTQMLLSKPKFQVIPKRMKG